MSEAVQIVVDLLKGIASSTLVVLALFIGFCVIVGFTKTRRTAGNAPVVKSLDEAVSRQSVVYLPPNAPRGPADQLHPPELREAAVRK